MHHIGTRPFTTERLICRPFVLEDAESMFWNWASDPAVQSEYGEPVYDTIEKTEALLEKYIAAYDDPASYRWAIIEKSSGENIGQIAFCRVYSDCRIAEIEYCIGKAFWGRGYAGEALAGLIDYAFAYTDFRKLEAYHRNSNRRSGRVLEKSQMHVTDNVERFRRIGQKPHDETCYSIEKFIHRGTICPT